MRVRIDVDTRTFIRFGFVTLSFVAGLFAIFKVQTALIIIGIAFFLAIALNPPVNRIAKLLPGRSRIGATAIAYLIVVGILGFLLFTVVPTIIEQTSKFASTVPGLIDQLNSQRGVASQVVHRYGLDPQFDQAIEAIKDQATNFAANLGNVLVGSVTSLVTGAATMLFILVLTFLMLIEGPDWLDKIWGLYEDPARLVRHKDLVHKMYRVVTGYVNGQLIVAVIASFCTLATVLILSSVFSLPPNLAFAAAAIVFMAGLIPMIGAIIGAVLVGLVLALSSPIAALSFIVYFIVYQQIENNFISPTIQSKAVELSALAVLTAIIIGTTLFGLLGGIISIPIAGCLRVIVLDYVDHNAKKRRRSSLVKKVITAAENA
jgi:predicted PurR-regulated permease PerM